MGIPLRDQRRKRRRSYADYRPPNPNRGPRDDPFRVVFYVLAIAGLVWTYFNQDAVRAHLAGAPTTPAVAAESALTAGPTPLPEQAQAGDTSAAALAALADQAYRAGKLADAIDYYQQAAEADPTVIDYQVQAARLLLFTSAMQYGQQREETLAAAEKAANAAILVDPFNPAGYAILGKVYDWQGHPEQALSTILQGLDYDPNYVLGLSYYAEAQVDLDRWDQAIETIEQALAVAPDNVDVRSDYAYIMERLGDYAAAATQYESALALHPNLPHLRMALGRSYRVLGRYDEAQDQFFEVQLMEPSNALVPFELGLTYETYIGDPNTALDYYERAVELDEAFGSAWLRVGTLRFGQERYTDAIAAFERALALDATNSDIYFQLGLSYANEGRCDTAVRYLQEAQSRAEGDERILDAVEAGYELCSRPTPIPVDVIGTPTPTLRP